MNRKLKRKQVKQRRKATNNRAVSSSRSFKDILAKAFHHLDKGDLNLAGKLSLKVLEQDPSHPVALHLQGLVASKQTKFDQAINYITKALSIDPTYTEAFGNLGSIQFRAGNIQDSLAAYFNAIALSPDNQKYWSGMALALPLFSFTSADENLLQYLLGALDQPSIRPKNIAKSIFSALKLHPDIADLIHRPGVGFDRDENYAERAERLSDIPLLIRILTLCGINDPEAENLLTNLRCWMLNTATESAADQRGLVFSVALANHCFVTDYVYSVSETEKNSVKELAKKILHHLEKDKYINPLWLCAIGAFWSLYGLPHAERILDREWSASLQPLLNIQLSEPLEEQKLRSTISTLTPIHNGVSRSVRDQYEENPFPRWTKTDFSVSPGTMEQVLTRFGISFKGLNIPFPKRPSILIAGCGTGAHAIGTATLVTNCQVLAVDLSLSSLAYALRKTNLLGIKNIQYGQADILELGAIGKTFDVIESVGVLHHTDDWLAGWRTLEDLLRPGGLMRIGLYSEMARQEVAWARNHISEKSYSPTASDIRTCRQDIKAMAANGDEKMLQLTGARDFYSLNDCRDLLFNVQEHHLTLPQIDDALKTLGLTFLGFEIVDDALMQKFQQANPEADASTSLSAWHQFEMDNPYTFMGMYKLWVQKPND